jgi:hypothetical protein
MNNSMAGFRGTGLPHDVLVLRLSSEGRSTFLRHSCPKDHFQREFLSKMLLGQPSGIGCYLSYNPTTTGGFKAFLFRWFHVRNLS